MLPKGDEKECVNQTVIILSYGQKAVNAVMNSLKNVTVRIRIALAMKMIKKTHKKFDSEMNRVQE